MISVNCLWIFSSDQEILVETIVQNHMIAQKALPRNVCSNYYPPLCSLKLGIIMLPLASVVKFT